MPFKGLRVPGGLYVRDGAAVFGYPSDNQQNSPPFCQQPSGFGPRGNVEFDGKGHLIGLNYTTSQITIYKAPRHSGECGSKLGSFIDALGQPYDAASLDAATGKIAVVDIGSSASLF